MNINSSFNDKSESLASIDFRSAVKLGQSGSICDTYLYKYGQRNLFIKRLKEEYRKDPFYLSALKKEFEIGFGLSHPHIPIYRGLGRDYIILDYIEGKRVQDLIVSGDKWINQDKNIRKILLQLIDLLEYLHKNNITHCDIKPDNLIITTTTRNLMLIDFDKSHTSVLNSTSGSPVVYEVDATKVGYSEIDFHGLGKLCEYLVGNNRKLKKRYRQFICLCFKENIDNEDLKRWFEKDKSIKEVKKRTLLISMLLVLSLFILSHFWQSPKSSKGNELTRNEVLEDPKEEGDESFHEPYDNSIKAPEERTVYVDSKGKEEMISTVETVLSEEIIKNNYSVLLPLIVTIDLIIKSPENFSEDVIAEKKSLLQIREEAILKETVKDLNNNKIAKSDKEAGAIIERSPYYKEIKEKIEELLLKLSKLEVKDDGQS